MIKRAYKYRCYRTDEQKGILARTFGCCRYIYNWALHLERWDPHLGQDAGPPGYRIGIDLGLTSMVISSQGEKAGNPRFMARDEQKSWRGHNVAMPRSRRAVATGRKPLLTLGGAN